MSLLSTIGSPEDLRALPADQLAPLAAEIRDFLIEKVSRTGGHLGPNLGAVELTLGLHRVFDSPHERILFDTGHQAYVHKILTGRQGGFDGLRQAGGLSGYPSRDESEHDLIENSHASTALSYADGLAKSYAVRGERRCVVAVVGDGALTGGMCWEALNNIAGSARPVIVVVNDNGRSYSPTIGGLADRLASLRLKPGYERILGVVKDSLNRTPVIGAPLYGALHGAKKGIKDAVAPQGLFEDLGLKYIGPVNGHDTASVESALRRAKEFGGPVVVHCVTRKGFGYAPAESDVEDCFHGPGAFDIETGAPLAPKGRSWTSIFGEEMVALGAERPDIAGITAAMLHPVGLAPFAEAYPDRTFDVGIAEAHAMTSAAGMAAGGMHPVVALYATFLNRAFDQLLMDVALHKLPVTVALDRSGITGDDGPSHNGMWDLSLLGVVPGIRVAAPRDEPRLRTALREAVAVDDGPTVIRYPKTPVPDDIDAVRTVGGVDVLREGTDVLIVSVGAMAAVALDAAERVAAEGIGATVVDPRWVRPVNPALVELARAHDLVVVVEDGGRAGSVGSAVAAAMRDSDVDIPLRDIALPQEFLPMGKAAALHSEFGLTGQSIARRVVEWVSGLAPNAEAVLASDSSRPDSNHS